MSGRAISKERWEKMLTATEDLDPTDPDFFKELAKAGRCKVKTAERAWRTGWPRKNKDGTGDLPAIRDVVQGRVTSWQLPARAIKNVLGPGVDHVAEEHRKEMNARAFIDAARVRAEEAMMVGLTRKATIRGIRSVLDNIEPMSTRMDLMLIHVDRWLGRKDGVRPADLERVSRMIHRMILDLKSLADTAGKLLQLERLLLGSPTDIIGVDVSVTSRQDVTHHVDPGNIDDVIARLQHSAEAVRRLRDPHPDDVSGPKVIDVTPPEIPGDQ